MLKYQRFGLGLLGFLGLWLGLLCNVLGLPLSSAHMDVIKALPMYVLVSFGSYSLAVIGFNLLKLEDCPEAAKELEQEIIEAREDLKRKGFTFQ